MDSRNSQRRDEFLDAYRRCAEANRVPSDRSVFYVKRVREFIDFLPGKRLKERSGNDISAFLADLGGRKGIADWQVRQAGFGLLL